MNGGVIRVLFSVVDGNKEREESNFLPISENSHHDTLALRQCEFFATCKT